MASSAAAQEHIFIGPGLSPFKRTVTILGVLGLTALVLWIAIYPVSYTHLTLPTILRV